MFQPSHWPAQVSVFHHESCSGGISAEWQLAGTATESSNLMFNTNLNHTANPNLKLRLKSKCLFSTILAILKLAYLRGNSSVLPLGQDSMSLLLPLPLPGARRPPSLCTPDFPRHAHQQLLDSPGLNHLCHYLPYICLFPSSVPSFRMNVRMSLCWRYSCLV